MDASNLDSKTRNRALVSSCMMVIAMALGMALHPHSPGIALAFRFFIGIVCGISMVLNIWALVQLRKHSRRV